MKALFLSSLFLFVSLRLFSQEVINANQLDSLDYIEWGNRPPVEEDQPDLWIMSICCFPNDYNKASSSLSSQGTKTYTPKNLSDDDPRTAWVEGKPDYGINEYLEIKTYETSFTHTLVIYNGYQSTISAFKNNSRVKKMGIHLDGKILYHVNLLDVMGGQSVAFPDKINEVLNDGGKHVLRLIILDVYPGTKWKDTAISEIYFQGC